MAKHKHVINLSEMAVDRINAPEGSPFGGSRQRVGAHIGAQKLGYSFFNVPPGKAAFPYHTHSGNEEMIYIIDGAGVLRFGKEEVAVIHGNGHRVSAGSGVSAPAHQHGRHGTSLPGCQYHGVSRYLRIS